MSPPRSLRRRLAFALLPLLLLEGLLRLLPTPRGGDPREYFDQDAEDPLHRKDPRLLWRLVPGVDTTRASAGRTLRWRINAQGLREPAPVGPPGGAPRLLCVGDSVTFGWLVEQDEAYCARLEQALRARGVAVRAINAGVPGYSSFQVRRQLDELLALGPSLVLAQVGINDSNPASRPDDRRALPIRLELAAGHLALFRDLRAAWSRLPRPSDPQDRARLSTPRVPLESFADNLEAMAAAARAAGARFVAIQPRVLADGALTEAWPAARREADTEALRSRVRALGRIDPAPELAAAGGPAAVLVPGDPCHWNATGHRAVADAVLRWLDAHPDALPTPR